MNIGLLGCGTIGSGVKEIIESIGKTKGLILKKVFDLPHKKDFLGALYVDEISAITDSPEIDAVVEAMGGEKLAYECITRALKNGKSVVTSNKEVVSNHFAEFMALAKQNKTSFLFEASVGGGIPVIGTLFNNVKVNDVDRIYGIINGTTNYVLTKMREDKLSQEDALNEARRMGFAEADATADIEGLDMVRKIAILSMIAYGTEIDVREIEHFGISKVTKKIIFDVEKLGYVLKFVAESKRKADRAFISVEPVLLKKNNAIANVNDEFNAIVFEGSTNGRIMLYGKGAGKYPTATAMVLDLISINEGKGELVWENTHKTTISNNSDGASYYVVNEVGDGKIVSAQEVKDNYVFKARIFED